MPLQKQKENPSCPDKPWITSGFKVSINKKWSLFHKWKKSKMPEDWLKYTKHLNLLTHLKKKAEILYYRNKAKLYGQDKSKTWQLVNEISNYKRKVKTNVKCIIDENGNELTDPVSKADCLNNHFGNVGKMWQKNIKALPHRPLEILYHISKKRFIILLFCLVLVHLKYQL